MVNESSINYTELEIHFAGLPQFMLLSHHSDFPPDLISRDGLGATVDCPVDAGCVVISQVEGSVEISVEETEAGSTKTFPLEPGRHRVAVFERGQDGVIGGQSLDVELIYLQGSDIDGGKC